PNVLVFQLRELPQQFGSVGIQGNQLNYTANGKSKVAHARLSIHPAGIGSDSIEHAFHLFPWPNCFRNSGSIHTDLTWPSFSSTLVGSNSFSALQNSSNEFATLYKLRSVAGSPSSASSSWSQ